MSLNAEITREACEKMNFFARKYSEILWQHHLDLLLLKSSIYGQLKVNKCLYQNYK